MNKIKVYGCGGHTSVRNALAWFKEHKIKVEYVSLSNDTSKGISYVDLEYAMDHIDGGLDSLVSTKAHAYKELIGDRDINLIPTTEMKNLLVDNYKLLKFPLIISEKEVLTGFNADDLRVFIPRSQRKADMARYLKKLHAEEGVHNA